MGQPTGRLRLEDLWRPDPAAPAPAPPEDGPPDTVPMRVRPGRRRFGPLALELLLASVVAGALAVAMNWDVARRLGRVVPGVGDEPFAQLWSLAWAGHALDPATGLPPRQLLDANAFHPAPHSFALADHLFGYGPLTWLFSGPTGLVTAYGVIFVTAPALAFVGGYALARQLGAHPLGGAVAGAGLAFPPWRLGQVDTLHLLALGPIVVALAMLARGHGLTMSGRRTPPRPLWALLGWGVAAWQLTVGIEVNLPFAYLLGAAAALLVLTAPFRLLAARRRRRAGARSADPYAADPYAADPYAADPYAADPYAAGPYAAGPYAAGPYAAGPYAEYDETMGDGAPPVRRRRWVGLVLADVVGAGLFTAVGAAVVYPFVRLRSLDPQALAAARSVDRVRELSPEPLGLVAPPDVDGTWRRLADTADLVAGGNDLRLLPGVVLLELALLGLVLSVWRWWWRVLLLVAVAGFAALSLGSGLPAGWSPTPDGPFGWLRRHAPGWDADVTPGRLVVFTTLAVALLAAGAAARLTGRDQGAGGPGGARRVAMLAVLLVLPGLVVAEGWGRVPVRPVPPAPAALAAASGPLVVLPSSSTTDGRAMFWSVGRGFPPLVNGQGPITPTALASARQALATFPDAASVAYLRQAGVRQVVVVKGAVPVPAPAPELGLSVLDLGDSLLYGVG